MDVLSRDTEGRRGEKSSRIEEESAEKDTEGERNFINQEGERRKKIRIGEGR